MKYLCLLFVALLASCSSTEKCQAVELFDGKTLNGWEALPGGEWSVKDGAIFGSQKKSEKRHGMLITKKQYSDFEVSLKYKAMKGNSGFYFRVAKVNHKVSVKGFQAEVDSEGNGQGGLYETLGRQWVVQPNKEVVDKFFKKHEWNEMTVRAVGRHVVITVNGFKTAELINDPGNLEGYFGLQLHGRQDMEVYFKDIRLKDLSNKNDVGISFMPEKIHDTKVPSPPIKKPFNAEQMAKCECGKAPSNAVMIFDGKDLSNFKNSNWRLVDGNLESSKGYIKTKQRFGSGRYHIEWRVMEPKSAGNSGIFIHGLYEVQIFNSHNDRTKIYADGQAGAIYGQYPPAFNVCREPGQWEYFDIDFTAPEFDLQGKLTRKATMTVYHNGIRIHKDAVLSGPTAHKKRPDYKFVVEEIVSLQDHGNKVQFRNFWFVAK